MYQKPSLTSTSDHCFRAVGKQCAMRMSCSSMGMRWDRQGSFCFSEVNPSRDRYRAGEATIRFVLGYFMRKSLRPLGNTRDSVLRPHFRVSQQWNSNLTAPAFEEVGLDPELIADAPHNKIDQIVDRSRKMIEPRHRW